jgi:hypothetical protein
MKSLVAIESSWPGALGYRLYKRPDGQGCASVLALIDPVPRQSRLRHRSRAPRWHDAVPELVELCGLSGRAAGQPARQPHRRSGANICDLDLRDLLAVAPANARKLDGAVLDKPACQTPPFR